ncbi:phage tail protein [Streptomyces sp. NPDC048419]|uniref:phage tail protein n=1 Tax=Streptomyces sp. NPDC048419 TaxID=3365547 RepID=UPI00371421B1
MSEIVASPIDRTASLGLRAGSTGPGINQRFQVTIDGQLNLGFWKSCKGLAVTFKSDAWYEGGYYDAPATYLPDKLDYPPITLERAVTQEGAAIVAKWLSDMARQWMDDRYCRYTGGTASITLADSELNPIHTWTLRGVFPSKWTGPDLDAMGAGAVALERLELKHTGFL